MAAQYLTLAGFQRLNDELAQLWQRKRPHIVKALQTAAAEGDRSENAEYIYRKKELRETDRKIRQLEAGLSRAKVVRDNPKDQSRVFFGAEVTLTPTDASHQAGDVRVYRLVGGLEARLDAGEISVDAPLAKRLLGRSLGDELPLTDHLGQKKNHEITRIRYYNQSYRDAEKRATPE
ncbi:MAG: GreA/GreB family elongation factor [Hydrogenovibrio sp.]|uniref:GreA/GreB family elongation factor n=1 Tax=Hydrogenovibrio TaxID=28884 RepID=UPI0003700BB2|nr:MULTISPECIES: GreA/GreB family elongation factor [Hydrogenovibrio]MDR9499296.1 GreA/GreB family elongation factor [Hydrogenovibrio sp.]